MYENTHSVTETIRVLGYPGRQTMYKWIRERNQPKKVKSTCHGDTVSHLRHQPVNLKVEVFHRCFEFGEDVKSVSDESRYSRASIYMWCRKYLREGITALMNPEDDPRGKLVPDTASSSGKINEFKSKMEDLRMQIDILKETVNVLKKTQASIRKFYEIGRRRRSSTC